MTVTDEPLVAGAIRSHNTETTDGEWSADEARRNLPNDEAALREAHAWAGDGNSSAKSNYSGLHHNVTQDGTVGAANLTACLSGIHALNRADSTIPAGDRGSVYAHLRNHLLAGGRSEASIPALRDPNAEASADEPITAAAADPAADVADVTYRAWRALAVLEGVWTGDDRLIESGALSWREFPLPLMIQTQTADGHDGARLGGRIDAGERVDASTMTDFRTGKPYGDGVVAVMLSGVMADDEAAREAVQMIEGDFLRGVSVDLSDVEYVDELVDADGNVVDIEGEGVDLAEVRMRTRITAARIMGLTATPFPAFEGAYIELVDADGNAGPATKPAQPTREQQAASVRASSAVYEPRACIPCQSGAITAAAAPVLPPRAWFDNPHGDEELADEDWPYVPVNVTASGRVYGRLALWDTCHIGYTDRCVKPPRSAINYSLFRRKPIPTAEGDMVKIGPLTVGTGHANTGRSTGMFATMAHYDNTGHVVADVAVGEDEHGIWVGGALRPDASPAQVRVLQASSSSGDWRDWGGNLELAAILMVNTPGFPIVRQLVADGRPQSLVASFLPNSGRPIVASAPELDELRDLLPELRASAAREQAARDQEAAALLARADEARGRMRTLTAAALRARVTMDR